MFWRRNLKFFFKHCVTLCACFLVWCLDNEAFQVRKLLLHKAYNVAIRQDKFLGSLLTIFTRRDRPKIMLSFFSHALQNFLRSLCSTTHIFDFCKILKTHFQELSHLFDDVKLRKKNAKLFTKFKEKSP